MWLLIESFSLDRAAYFLPFLKRSLRRDPSFSLSRFFFSSLPLLSLSLSLLLRTIAFSLSNLLLTSPRMHAKYPQLTEPPD